jgi:hypothetical protein
VRAVEVPGSRPQLSSRNNVARAWVFAVIRPPNGSCRSPVAALSLASAEASRPLPRLMVTPEGANCSGRDAVQIARKAGYFSAGPADSAASGAAAS